MSWPEICSEGEEIVAKDSFMAPIIKRNILNHPTFSSAISFLLAESFAGVVPFESWQRLILSVYDDDSLYEKDMLHIEDMGFNDLKATNERDPACDGLINPFLNFKGFKALQSHRVAHVLWKKGRKDSARFIQSRCSELYAVDIHPAAVIGTQSFTTYITGNLHFLN